MNAELVGCMEWHSAQRVAMIVCTRAKVTVPLAAGAAVVLGRMRIAITRTASAADAGIHQTVRPSWRRLK